MCGYLRVSAAVKISFDGRYGSDRLLRGGILYVADAGSGSRPPVHAVGKRSVAITCRLALGGVRSTPTPDTQSDAPALYRMTARRRSS